MAGEWKTVTLRDALGAKGYIRGPFGSALRRPELKSSGIPVYEQQHAITGTREFRFYIDEEKYSTLRRFAVQPNDLIVSCSGTLARVSMIREEDPVGIISQALLILRPDTSVVWPKYLYYFMSSKRGYDSLVGVSTGSVQVNIAGRSVIEQTELPLPPLPHQRAIACILGALDDKIELNRRMNETLEQIAQAIFKIWFIEPTKNGKLPEGWREGKISDICSTQYGFTASATDKPIGPYFLRVTDINKQNWINWTNVPHCSISNEDKQKYKLHVGDILVARMADPGKSAIVEQEVDAVFASYLVRLKTKSLAHAYYLFYFLKSPVYLNYSEAARSGSVQANMNAKVIVDASLPIPSSILIEGFFAKVLPIRKRIIYNLTQSATLAALRDTLLPKLLSGELRVPDAEKICARGASALGGMERCV